VWNKEGVLAGGGYGVAAGNSFVIESQFFRESNASKIGFTVLAWHLAKWGFRFCDNKWQTPTTVQMGFTPIKRAALLALLRDAKPPRPRGRWHAEAGARAVSAWRPDEPD
jgi:leucyl/phenylalanyl-tRNA--protein transferase